MIDNKPILNLKEYEEKKTHCRNLGNRITEVVNEFMAEFDLDDGEFISVLMATLTNHICVLIELIGAVDRKDAKTLHDISVETLGLALNKIKH